jgi:hypothetical protein
MRIARPTDRNPTGILDSYSVRAMSLAMSPMDGMAGCWQRRVTAV